MNKLVAGLVIVPAWICVVLLGYGVTVLEKIYADTDLAAQQSVQIKNSIQGLPQNFENNR